MNNEQIVHEISGKRYVLIELLNASRSHKEVEDMIKKLGMVYQGIKEIKPAGFWTKGYAILNYLLPEENFDLYKKLSEE